MFMRVNSKCAHQVRPPPRGLVVLSRGQTADELWGLRAKSQPRKSRAHCHDASTNSGDGAVCPRVSRAMTAAGFG
jgi:hypothetical protein